MDVVDFIINSQRLKTEASVGIVTLQNLLIKTEAFNNALNCGGDPENAARIMEQYNQSVGAAVEQLAKIASIIEEFVK